MKFLKDKTGFSSPIKSEYDIATDTAIKPGQVVVMTAGKVALAAVDVATAILGVADEAHGTADALNLRATGLKISVMDSPSAIFETPATVLTATGGNTTTMITTSGLVAESGTNTFVDNDFNGGYLKLTEKAAASTNTDPVGTIYSVSDFDAGDRTFTINTAGGAVTAGDKFALFPPVGFVKGNLNSTRDGFVYTAVAALPLQVTGHNLTKETLEVAPVLHQFGNKVS